MPWMIGLIIMFNIKIYNLEDHLVDLNVYKSKLKKLDKYYLEPAKLRDVNSFLKVSSYVHQKITQKCKEIKITTRLTSKKI